MKHKNTVRSFIDALQARGWYVFSKDDALQHVHLQGNALNVALRRQEQAGRILKIRNGFYVIVPLEHQAIGSIPVEWFLDSLMVFHNQPYYMALLSAASHHGATHQAIQTTQVITSRKISPIHTGRFYIEFIQKKNMTFSDIQQVKTPMGTMNLSTPEQTAFDIIHFLGKCGHLNHVATVLDELSDKLSGNQLMKLAPYQEKTTLQRLGYILENLGKDELAQPLADYIKPFRLPYIGLRPDAPLTGFPIAKKWHLYMNHTLEVDAL